MEDMNWEYKKSFLEELTVEVSFERVVIKMFIHFCGGGQG